MNLKEIIKKAKTLEDLKRIKSSFYAKGGQISQLLKEIANTQDKEKKRTIGQQLKNLKEEAENLFAQTTFKLKKEALLAKIRSQKVDVTHPVLEMGGLHPLTLVKKRFREWLLQHGYFEMRGSQIVSDEYNFERLNMGVDHPARDMHDSLYLDKFTLFRTHNTGFSALALEKFKDQEFGQFSIGKVFRNDTEDQTHTHQFHQVDILLVDKKASIANLIWTLTSMLSYVFEEKVQIRLRPSFFPFTTPSLEVDVFLRGKWIEILGAGMVHPEVLKKAGYTDLSFKAFAAGIGVERVAMIKYQINDLRYFIVNDLRFLKQFNQEES